MENEGKETHDEVFDGTVKVEESGSTQTSSTPRTLLADHGPTYIALAAVFFMFGAGWLFFSKNITAQQSGATEGFLVYSALSLISLIMIMALWMILRWRANLIRSGTVYLVPEKWGSVINKNTQISQITYEQIIGLQRAVLSANEHAADIAEKQLEETMKYKELLSNAEHELNKLRGGYEATILKRYYRRLIRLHQTTRELIVEEPDSKNIIFLNRMVETALEDCLITLEQPIIGSDSRDLGELISDRIQYETTSDDSQNHKVFEIRQPAYVYDAENTHAVIEPAEVSVFRYSKEIESKELEQ